MAKVMMSGFSEIAKQVKMQPQEVLEEVKSKK
jgi:hypothetical protein